MSIKLRGTTWHIDVTICGVLIRKSLKTSDKRTALARAKELEEAAWRGEMLPKKATTKGLTLKDAFDDIYADRWAVEKDAKGVLSRFETLCRFLPGDTPVLDIDRPRIKQLKRDMKKATYTRSPAQDAKQYPYSDTTINRVLSLLGTLMNDLVKDGKLDFVPDMSKAPEVSRKRYLSEAEEALMWKTLEESNNPNHRRCKRLFEFLLETGCRVGEVFKLRWRDVQWDTQSMVLVDTKSGDTVGKALTERAVVLLRDEREEGHMAPFSGIGETMYRNAWEHALKPLDLDPEDRIVRHSLRHTTATRLVRMGVSLSHVQEYLGHKSYQTTLGYAHHTGAGGKAAASALNGVRKM